MITIFFIELSCKKQNFSIEEPIKSPSLNILMSDEDEIAKDKNYTPTKHFSKYEPGIEHKTLF